MGLLALTSTSCSPKSDVKPGAPVLLSFAIVEAGGNTTTITADTNACAGQPTTGDDCDPSADGVCKLSNDQWCRCLGTDPDDPSKAAWNCDPFAPMSVVIATFDRLLDTDPLDPGDAGTTRDDIVTITATPKPPVDITSATDYASNGSPNGAVFNVLGPLFFGNHRSGGPSLQTMGAPALAAGASINFELQADRIQAKDGKTQFVGDNLLADGAIAFKTAPLTADMTIPTAPPPPPMDGGANDGGADGGATSEGGTDGAAHDGAADGGATEGGASEGGATDGGTADAASEAGASEAGAAEGGTDTAVADASGSDASASEAGAGDAAAEAMGPKPVVVPPPGAPVPADMNMTAVVITFNNIVDPADVEKHVKVMENGQTFKVHVVADPNGAPNVVNILPGDADPDVGKHEWAAGKTYAIVVDADVADVVGDKLGTALAASFMMAN